MNDKEMLDLIEHYKWEVTPLSREGGGWQITATVTIRGAVLARHQGSLREAVRMALASQARIAMTMVNHAS